MRLGQSDVEADLPTPAAPRIPRPPEVRELVSDALRQLPAGLRLASNAARRRPPMVTLTLIACIVVTYLRLDPGGSLPPLRFVADAYSPRAVIEGHVRLLATSTLLTYNIFMLVSICISLLVALGAYEVLAGHVRALVLAVAAAIIGPFLVAGGLGILVALGSSWAEGRLGTLDIGASAIVAMASGGVAGIVHDRRLTLGLVLFLIGGLLVHHRTADWEHLTVFPFGYAAGRFLGHRPASRTAWTPRRIAAYLPASLAFLAAALTVCSVVMPSAAVAHGAGGVALSPPRLVDTSYPAPSIGGMTRRVLVYLPAGYDSGKANYPVVELLHGYPGRPDDFFSLGGLQSILTDPRIARFIAVMPDGNGPHLTDSWFADIPSQQMGTATSNDVRAWVGARFRINRSWSYAGLSSGGYAAASLPLIDTGSVHATCSLSGFYSPKEVAPLRRMPPALRRRQAPLDNAGPGGVLNFLAYGRHDVRATREARLYRAVLVRHHRPVLLRTYPGTHQWAVWRPAFRDCFRLILPTR